MEKELELLDSIHIKNKISTDEYNLLSQAIRKKTFPTYFFYNLINPFQKIAGIKALVIGLGVLMLMSAVGIIANVYYAGFYACIAASNFPNSRFQPNFLLLLYQNVVSCSLLAVFYFLAAKMLRQRAIRLIDFMGTVFLSRYPMLFFTVIIAFISIISPHATHYNVAHTGRFLPTIMSTALNALFLLVTIWQIMTYFFALKESSGLTGNRLWASFILIFVLGHIVTEHLSLIFLK